MAYSASWSPWPPGENKKKGVQSGGWFGEKGEDGWEEWLQEKGCGQRRGKGLARTRGGLNPGELKLPPKCSCHFLMEDYVLFEESGLAEVVHARARDFALLTSSLQLFSLKTSYYSAQIYLK